jgi:hypothetical protein
MQRLLELLFGAERQNLPDGATVATDFNPPDWMQSAGPALVNVALAAVAIAVVAWAYSRDGRSRGPRLGLGLLRLLLIGFVLLLINRPVLKITETRTEPSVVAVLVDDSISMYLRDTGSAAYLARAGSPASRPTVDLSAAPATGPAASQPAVAGGQTGNGQPAGGQNDVEFIGGTGPTRLDVAVGLLTGDGEKLIRTLAAKHALRFYRFSRDATEIGSLPPPAAASGTPVDPAGIQLDPKLVDAIRQMQPTGGSTQLVPSLLTVLNNLQGQQVDGVVVLTDARETPAAAPAALVDRLKRFDVKFFPVTVGSEKPPRNLSVASLSVQDSAFKDDIVTAKVAVRATGYEPGKSVRVRLRDKKTRAVLRTPDGKDAEATVTLPDDRPQEAEVSFQPKDVGTLEVVADIDVEEGELDARDNASQESVAVLDAKVNVLYVDGYPRWEYRYIKNEMIRDRTVNISCLLTSADEKFRQEGDPPDPSYDKPAGDDGTPAYRDPRTGTKFPGPITRFPETEEELRKYDVVLFGDVDPRQFSSRQIKMVADFVENEAGGFGMISGPQNAPFKYRNTPIDAMLPVSIATATQDEPTALFRDGWRPVVTDEGRRGEGAMIFRFFADKEKNDKYLREDLQPLFWYARGVSAKQGAGLVYSYHPGASDPFGQPAPILVLGKFGSGRTLFSGIDDSWRWLYYTGEEVFRTYWVQQVRYLARGRKLAERGIKFTVDRERYERGQQVRLSLTVLSPKLLKDARQVKVDVVDEADRVIRQETLQRQESPDNVFSTRFVANDRFGSYRVRLAKLSDAVDAQERSFQIIVPRQELERPEVDRDALRKLAPDSQILTATAARDELPKLITGEAKVLALPPTNLPIWNTWRALTIFMLLLTAEWVLRKVFGMM